MIKKIKRLNKDKMKNSRLFHKQRNNREYTILFFYRITNYCNEAACTPSTPASAPATAIITFKITLHVFFINISFVSNSTYLYLVSKCQLLKFRIRSFFIATISVPTIRFFRCSSPIQFLQIFI